MNLMLAVLFLLLLGLILLASGLALRFFEAQGARKMAGSLDTVAQQLEQQQFKVLVQLPEQSSEFFEAILRRLNLIARLQSRLRQSGLGWPVQQLLFSMLVAALVGAALGYVFPLLLSRTLTAVAGAGLLGLLPWWYVGHAARKRFDRFEDEFPEALDFLARALRAGHAFPVSLDILAKNSPEPLRTEFACVYNEQNLGEALPVALMHLAERVPLVDVRFFVSAVLIQRETGGNLGEILTRLASIIRDRFRLKGAVKAASAHGRLTAGILTLMPLCCALGFSVVAPTYLSGMVHDKDGRYLLLGAVLAQTTGYLIMRRIVNIKI